LKREFVHSLTKHLTPVNKINNLYANHLKIQKKHCRPWAVFETPGLQLETC